MATILIRVKGYVKQTSLDHAISAALERAHMSQILEVADTRVEVDFSGAMRFPRKSRHPTIRLEGRLEGCQRGSNPKEVHAGVQN